MTGFDNRIVNSGLQPLKGYWTVIDDSRVAARIWNRVSWTGNFPAGCTNEVYVRADDDRAVLASDPFVSVTNGSALSDVKGRYIEVRVAMTRDSAAKQPVLYDLTLYGISSGFSGDYFLYGGEANEGDNATFWPGLVGAEPMTYQWFRQYPWETNMVEVAGATNWYLTITNVDSWVEGTVALDRFRLRDEVDRKIEAHRNAERRAAFQVLLLPESPLFVAETRVIDFRAMGYEPSWLYEGGFVFKKHYFGPKPGEVRDGTEEFECAQFLDGLSEVKYWVRNLSRKPSSFRLQSTRDWFYPDFVCQLTDGRILVVEYKGGNADKGWYAMPDSEAKRAVGAVWEGRSGGKCLFIMPPGKDFAAILRKITG